ncbi:MAG: glycosyltransferase family 1 protein [Bacteroidota bacterium]
MVKALLQCDSSNHYYLFLIEPNDLIAGPNLTKVMIGGYGPPILNRYWENVVLPKELRRYNIDIFFGPAYVLPYFVRFGRTLANIPLPLTLRYFFNSHQKVKYVVTIHDVISRIYPQYFTFKMRIWQRFFMWNAQRSADRVIADSQSTKNDILRFYPAYRDRVTVIYPELDDRFRIITDDAMLVRAKKKYSLPEKFILYIGTIEPRKNVESIAAAYSNLPSDIQSQFDLVIGGNIGWYAEKIFNEIKIQRLEQRIHFIGYVDDSFLPSLLTLASVFVFPSFYEGFGYPPLEAMACGVPVVSSNTSSLSEAVGNAAILVDPASVQQISKAIGNILSSRELAAELQRKGLERVNLFSRKKCAEATLEVFKQAVLQK